jgi:pentatricopeptide repeat protein
MDVSLCMIARNEASRLGPCLASVRSAVREVIVVDTGSTDETKAIASDYGAKVFDFPWCDDFAAARNESIRHASCPWILWLDADDRLDGKNLERLRGLFASLDQELVAYMMQTASVSGSGRLQSSHPLARLFPNDPRVRWERRVHEQIVPSIEKLGGTLRFTDLIIHHYGYTDVTAVLSKAKRNLRLSELECIDRPFDAYAEYCRGVALSDLNRHTEALIALNLAAGGALPELASRRLYATMVRCYLREGSPRQALEVLEGALSLFPGDPELLYTEVQLCGASGQYARAEQSMRLVLATQPEEGLDCNDAALAGPRGRYMLALLCAIQYKYEDAEREARASIATDPTYAPAWLVLADSLSGLNRTNELEALLALPGIPAAAQVQLRMYLRAIQHDPQGARDEFHAAEAYIRAGMSRAEEWLTKVSEGATPRLLGLILRDRSFSSVALGA